MKTIDNIYKFYLAAILLLVLLLYLPALNGPFLYDDHTNLAWQSKNYIDNLSNIPRLLTSGISSELGRPVAVLSFLFHPMTYPESATPYKLFNLILHLINTILVFILSKQLFTKFTVSQLNTNLKLTYNFALVSAMLWALHPLFISSTMYVIQRMTLLSFLFSLIALIYFISISEKKWPTYFTLVKPISILSLFILLGVLSKENAVLILIVLPVLIFNLKQPEDSKLKTAIYIYSAIGMLLLIIKLMPYAEYSRHLNAGYHFSVIERLLTQVTVLVEYLKQIVVPDIGAMSLHHDNYPIVRSVSDMQFMFSAFVLSTLLLIAYFTKNKIIRIGILWFFIWHVLESTFLPLILYFEHRNYLPALGLIWVVASLYIYSFNKFPGAAKLLLIIPVAYLSISTLALTGIWSKESSLIAHWHENNPDSERISLAVFNNLVTQGDNEAAFEFISSLDYRLLESSLILNFAQISVGCTLNKDVDEPLQLAEHLSNNYQISSKLIKGVHTSVHQTLRRNIATCKDIYPRIQQISENLVSRYNQIQPALAREIIANQGFLYLSDNNISMALVKFEEAYVKGRKDLIIALVDLNLRLGNIQEAEKHLFIAERLVEKNYERYSNMLPAISVLQQKIFNDKNKPGNF